MALTSRKRKALHIVGHLKIAKFSVSAGWIDRFKRRHKIVYTTLSGKSRNVDPETVEDWKNYRLLQETEGYDLHVIYNADGTGLFFNPQPSKTFTFRGDFCHAGIKSEHQITVLLVCNADCSDKLDNRKVHVASRMSRDCLQNMKLIQILR
jgi:hypothetical protein